MSIFAEPPLSGPGFGEWADEDAIYSQDSTAFQSDSLIGLPWSTSSKQECYGDIFTTPDPIFSTPQKTRGPRQQSDFWTQSRRAIRDEAATSEAFHRRLRASTSQPDLLSFGCYPSPPLLPAPSVSKHAAQIPYQASSCNVGRSCSRSPSRKHDASRGRPAEIVKPAASRRSSASPSKTRNPGRHRVGCSPKKPKQPASADRIGSQMIRDANNLFDDHCALFPPVARKDTKATASALESQFGDAAGAFACRAPTQFHPSGRPCAPLSNVPHLAIPSTSSAAGCLTDLSDSAIATSYDVQSPIRQSQLGAFEFGTSSWLESDPFCDNALIAETSTEPASSTQDGNVKFVSGSLNPNADADYDLFSDLFSSDLHSSDPLWQLQYHGACMAPALDGSNGQAGRGLNPLIESELTAFSETDFLWDPSLPLEDYPGWPLEQVGSHVDYFPLFADLPAGSSHLDNRYEPELLTEGIPQDPCLSDNTACSEPPSFLCTKGHAAAQALSVRNESISSCKQGTSPSKPAIRERSTRARARSPAKAHPKAAASSRGGVTSQFVNFTAQNSGELLRGVAPSGSNKTKAKREKEAAAQQRRIHEAAVQAVLEVGGNIEGLRRMRLS